MIQCFQCEDWFHNKHLLPPILSEPEEEYILICRSCLPKIGTVSQIIFPYFDLIHPAFQKAFQMCYKDEL